MRGHRVKTTLIGLCLVLAGVCYSSWVLDYVFHSGLDPMRSFLSELDSGHMPHRQVYVTGDVLTGVFALLAGGGLVFAIVVLATVWMLAADRLDGDYRLGLAQRIQVGGMSVWLAFWGVAITRWTPAAPSPEVSDGTSS